MANYKDTLNLPSTDFSMRANLSDREPEAVERWEAHDVYGEMISHARQRGESSEGFIFHDGPPYANGHIHHGHILNKVLKDFVVKYQNMAGHPCAFVPGWDCHGLPIEHRSTRSWARRSARCPRSRSARPAASTPRSTSTSSRDEFRASWSWRLGRPVPDDGLHYEAKTVRELGAFFDSGLVYQALKPVHWDWAAQTALAEAEVEYDAFTTEHVYVKFPFDQLPEELAEQSPPTRATSSS